MLLPQPASPDPLTPDSPGVCRLGAQVPDGVTAGSVAFLVTFTLASKKSGNIA